MVLFSIFPIRLKETIIKMIEGISYDEIEEIRLRAHKPVVIKCRDKHIVGEHIATYEEVNDTIGLAVEHSVYAHSDEIKNGYITIEGGHRIGVCGQVVCENGVLRTVKYISSVNIRVAHQIKGCSDKIINYIYNSKIIRNTLIISSPGFGKTTLLRDIVRQLSDKGIDIGVVDERGEIAAGYFGIAQNDVGRCTDVLSFCPKSIGMTMLIRSMAPKIVVADEIGSSKDIKALVNAGVSGCKVFATMHGNVVNEINEDIKAIFELFIFIYKKEGKRLYEVYDTEKRLGVLYE